MIFHGVFPGLTTEINALMNRALPASGGIGARRARGSESETPITRSNLTLLNRQAAVANNQFASEAT